MTDEEYMNYVGELRGQTPVNPESKPGEIARQTAYFITGQCAVSDMDRKEQLIQNAIDQAIAVRDEEWHKRWNREMAILQDKSAASEEIEYLRKELRQWNDLKVALGAKDSTAFFDALANRDREITRLRKLTTEQSAMMEEAITIFDRYLNVPESVALRKRWESFKNQTL